MIFLGDLVSKAARAEKEDSPGSGRNRVANDMSVHMCIQQQQAFMGFGIRGYLNICNFEWEVS